MKKLILSIFLMTAAGFSAQIGTATSVSSPDSKWTFGGYAGLGGAFGNGGGVSVYVSPRVGYKVTEN
ncbi:MAG: hypothetical protein ACXWCF_05770, partial [Kaistella sp.]